MEQGPCGAASRLVNEFPVPHKTRRHVMLVTRAWYRFQQSEEANPHPVTLFSSDT